MIGTLQRCAAAQQRQLQCGQSSGKPALRRSKLSHVNRAKQRPLQASGSPDDPQPEPVVRSPVVQQQQLNAVTGDQQQMPSDQQPEQHVDQQPGQLAESAADAQQEAAVAVAEYLGDEQAAEEEELLHRPVREIDVAASKAAEVVYLSMGAGLAVSGLAIASYAVPVAASCLRLGGVPLTQAAALVGCIGAGLLRAAALAFFLAGGASVGELGTWRYQRINLALMACCAITALIQPLSWSAAQPWLLAMVFAAAAAGAAACGRTFLQQWRKDGIIYASAVGYGDWIQGIQAVFVYLLRDMSTVAGLLLAVLAAVATAGGLLSLTGSATAVAVPWLTGAAATAQLAGLQYLHKLLGVGLLLTAIQCWALGEFAGQARHVSPETAIKVRMVTQQEQYEYISGQLPAPLHVPPSRFGLLHIGFLAAAVVQGLWLWTAASVGGPAAAGLVNLNSADAVWAPLHWSVLCSAAYLATNVFLIDFIVVWESLVGFASYLSGWVSFFTVILYADWEWLKDVRRR